MPWFSALHAPASARRPRRPSFRGITTIERLEQRRVFAGWPAQLSGSAFDFEQFLETYPSGSAIATLPDGSSLVTGHFTGTATFGSYTLSSFGLDDIFVAKLNPDGSCAWANRAGGKLSDAGFGIAAFPDGSALVTGKFDTQAVFGGWIVDGLNDDAFVAKLSPSGSWTWAKAAGGWTTWDKGLDVATCPDGSAVVTGLFYKEATFGKTKLTSTSYEMFVTKLAADGSFTWARQASPACLAEGVTVLSDGSCLLTGTFEGTATFGTTVLTSLGKTDVFVARLDPQGAFVWATRGGAAGSDYARAIAGCGDGSAIITGIYDATTTFGSKTMQTAGNEDVFIAKIDAVGKWSWATRAGGLSNEYPHGVSSRADGSVIVTGSFKGKALFGDISLESSGAEDAFITGIDADGAFAWAVKVGGPDKDYGAAVSTAPDGTARVLGGFNGKMSFGGTTFWSSATSNIFVAKIFPGGSFLQPPGLPTNVVATPSAGGATVTWTAPAAHGGPPITDYAVRYRPAGGAGSWKTASEGTSTATSVKVTGLLVDGTSYDFRVAAVSSVGSSEFVPASMAVTPFTTASAPEILSTLAGDARVTLSWGKPASDGHAAITSYSVQYATVLSGGRLSAWKESPRTPPSALTATVTGLKNGLPYVFRVAAINAAGQGATKPTLAPVRPFTKPSAVSVASASAGNASVKITWAAPSSDGGAPIVSYLVQYAAVPRPNTRPDWKNWVFAAATNRTATITGLTNGVSYLFRVAAVNKAGYGDATPTARPVTPLRSSVSGVRGAGLLDRSARDNSPNPPAGGISLVAWAG